MTTKRLKRPRDPVQLGKLIGDILTGQIEDTPVSMEANAAAVEFARKGGIKGGKVRAERLTPEQRAAIARTAAEARWKKS